MKKPPAVRSGIVFLLCLIFITGFARAQTGGASPSSGTFFLQSAGEASPPYPFDPYFGSEPVETINASNRVYLIQDSPEDFAALQEVKSLIRMSLDVPTPGDGGDSGGGDYTNSYFSTFSIDTNLLWLEITNVDLPDQVADLLLHNTTNSTFYQLLSKTNLLQTEWALGEYRYGESGANETAFAPVSLGGNPMMFFRAQQADCLVYITAADIAIEPQGTFPGQTGTFNLIGTWAIGATNDVTVCYSISGTASNGVDYTNLSGVAVLTNGVGGAVTVINVQPIADSLVEGSETVTLTLVPASSYVILSGYNSATIHIYDSWTIVSMGVSIPDAIEPNGPPGSIATTGLFWFSRHDFRGLGFYPDLDVYYQISGTASNGVDYSLLSGVIHFADGMEDTNLVLNPLADSIIEGLETVTLTLIPTNTYLIDADTNATTGTVTIIDSTTTVSIYGRDNAVEPNPTNNTPGQTGYFELDRTDISNSYPALTIYYGISGTASNGVDYTNLTGQVTFGAGETMTNIFVQALADNLLEGDETVILTLVATNGYLIDTNADSAIIAIADTVTFTTVTIMNSPIGIDYHAPANSLIVSYNYGGGSPYNFARIYTNLVVSNSVVMTNLVVTNWSGVHGAGDEVKLATVKTNVGGFTNGDIYFSSGGSVGWVSADGTTSNMNWCVLTNSTVVDALPLRGSLYVDQSGVFSNQVIAVTSEGDGSSSLKGVWRVDAQAHPTLLANLATAHLEGVITLPNDTNRWGPWAGKIITGDEDSNPPLIYTIATNGTAVAYDTTALIAGGIHPEDFDIIPTNQDLYCVAFDDASIANSSIVKLSRDHFSNYVGDLLITDAGERAPAALYIVHWDAATTNFVTRRILFIDPVRRFEHVTFAPIDFPTK